MIVPCPRRGYLSAKNAKNANKEKISISMVFFCVIRVLRGQEVTADVVDFVAEEHMIRIMH